jgi:general secretion pathway protein J
VKRALELRYCHRRLLGFTLIEVMVATFLMALMGMLLMTSINSSISAKDAVEETSGRYQLVRQAMSRMAREIAMAYLSKNINHSDAAYVTQFKGKKESLYFSAFGNVVYQKDAKQSDQQVLGFYLATDKNGQQSLMRRMQPNLNRDVEKGGVAQVLCPNVTKLEFSYFDGRLEKWEETWVADPVILTAQGQIDTEAPWLRKNKKEENEQRKPILKSWRLPSFVKILMTAEMGKGSEMTWVTETEILIQDPLDLN